MSRDGALSRARSLRESLLDHGVRKVSIELQQGRPGTPNSRWWDDRFVAELSHHTVSRPSNGDTPVLALCKSGRSDVPGPLCNGYGGYDEVYRIICMGWANHPGAGGPLTLAGYRIPYNTGRPYMWGTEYEGGLEDWSDSMHEFMARSNAGILDWLDRPVEAHGEHSTWTIRKIDRRKYTATSGRNRIRPYMGLTEPKDWFDMATKADLAQVVDARVDQLDAQILRLKELHEQTRSQLSSTEAALSQTLAALEKVMLQLEEKRKADVLRDKQIHDMTRQMIEAHHGQPIAVTDPRERKGDK